MEPLHKQSILGTLKLKCLAVFTVRSVLILLLQVVHAAARKKYSTPTSTSQPAPAPDDLAHKSWLTYRCLVYLGAQYRDGEEVGIMIMGLETTFRLAIYCQHLLGHVSQAQQSNDLYLFMNEPRAGLRNIASYLDELRHLMSWSEYVHRKRALWRARAGRSTGQRSRKLPNDLFSCRVNQESVEFKRIQSQHRKLTFWPSNRTLEWRAHLERLLVRLYVSMHVTSFFITCFLLYELRKLIIDRNKIKLTLLDRLSLIEEQVSFTFIEEIIFYSIIDFVIRETDRRQLHAYMDSRISVFLRNMEHLREVYCGLRSADGGGGSVREDRGAMTRAHLEEARLYCNREALQLYLAYRYFIMTQAGQRVVGTRVVSQFAFGCIGYVFCVFPAFWHLDAEHYRVIGPLFVLGFLFSSLLNVLGSSSTVKLTRTCLLFWKLLAYSNLPAFCVNETRTSKPDRPKRRLTNWEVVHVLGDKHRYALVAPGSGSDSVVGGGAPQQLVEEHTRFLWAQLIHDWRQTSYLFSYVVLGLFAVSYGNLIRIQFWCLSLGLKVLSKTLYF